MVKIKAVALLILLSVILCSCQSQNIIETETPYPESEPEFGRNEVTETQPVTEEIPEEVHINLVACGDNIVYYGNVRDALTKDGIYDFSHTYSDVKDIISSADIAFINQETLMCGDGYDFSYYPQFNGPQDMGKDLVSVGFDVICMANNHMLDKGESGLLSTINFWDSMPVLRIGAYTDIEDYDNIRIIERNGKKTAFLAYTYATNGLSLPSGSKTVVPYFDKDTIQKQVTKAKELADFVIVSAHWGDEYTFTVNDFQKEYSALFCELGVDLIIGHHPHVIQSIEWMYNEDGHKTLCVYSLGNFMAEMDRAVNMVGGILSVDITFSDDIKSISSVEFIPTVFDFTTNFYNNHIYLLNDYTEDQARSHGIRAYGRTTSLSELRGFVLDNIDAEFLSDAFLNNN